MEQERNENNIWKNRYAIRTAFDNLNMDINTVTDIIRETIESRSKYLKRAELKPMAKVRTDKDSHDTSRALHMRQAAEISKLIAHKLGLNEMVAYTGMLMHDSGHAFFGHEGEHTMNIAGKLLNVGYFHHNAKGIDVILSENLIGKIIDAIPEAKHDKNLRESLEKDAWYFLDVVISHDGEASLEENKILRDNKKSVDTNDIKEIVLNKTRKSNSENIYKCNPETLESIISKPSDVIAYIKSDMIDAFSESIVVKFDDEHFEIIGGILCENKNEREENLTKTDQEEVKKERIKRGKEYLLECRKKYLREFSQDIDKNIEEKVEEVLKEAKEKGIDIFNIYTKDDIEEDMQETVKRFKIKLNEKKISRKEYKEEIKNAKKEFVKKYEKTVETQEKLNNILKAKQEEYKKEKQQEKNDSNTIASGVNKIEEYTQKLTKERKRVVEDVMNEVQKALIEDYVQTTKENWKDKDKYEELKEGMRFSKGMEKLLYNRLKKVNYSKYVQYSKKEYQEKSVPTATFKTIKECAKALVKTGAIRDKFYDQSVLTKVQDEKVKEHMKVPDRNEEEYETFKRKIGITKGIKLIRPKKKNEKTRFLAKKEFTNVHRRKLYKDIYNYVQTQDTRFAMNCEDVYYAIDNTVKTKVKEAYSRKFIPDDYLRVEQLKEIENIKKQVKIIEKRLLKNNELTKEQALEQAKEEYIETTIQKERNNLEEKVAQEIVIKYLAGMTDRKIVDTLLKIRNLSWVKYKKEDKLNQKGNKIIKELMKAHSEVTR